MNDNPFLQRYRTTDSSELLDIIANASDYQPLAVEAAQLELESRQLTQEQLSEAKDKLDCRQKDKANKQQKIKDIEQKVKSVGASVVDTFNPIKTEATATSRYIKNITLFIGFLFCYQLYKDFSTIKFMFTAYDGMWDISILLEFAPLLFLPIIAYLFWSRKKIGWILATIYFSQAAAGAILMFIMELNREPMGAQALDVFSPKVSPIVYVGTLIIFGGLVWSLCQKKIRVVYKVGRKSMFFSRVMVNKSISKAQKQKSNS